MTIRIFVIPRIMMALVCLTPLFTFAVALPDNLTVSYSVTHGKLKLGSIEKTLTRHGDSFKLVADTKANAMTQLFTGDLHEEATFKLEGETLYPLQYAVVRDGKKGYQRRVTFDWKQRLLNYDDGRVEDIPAGYVADSGSIFFALMLDAARPTTGDTVAVVTGKGVNMYSVEIVGEETLKTPLGELNTLKLIQTRIDKPDRQLSVWLAVDKGNLPVKIEQQKKGKISTLMIESVSGL
ncbi:MAG: DUF3108 domain-containing protein [Gammaproteobacteria bacterium]|nr:DUF3108 domain-containing protein [Gammaproteobacteria bacterium]